ncbi:14550_t:CDS:2 [Cetraspora pellucida]|uniref:14550_t:CDS:1 n=1 Tax=Cetraspora pellucida TaxID=1433469 RepID=A0ACA9LPC4_9GLOM|nr:14550_t:CDS:2 [Cetraspora pellucida]
MSSIFISFCFIKTITGNDKYVSGSALYRIKDNEDAFREIIYKGFTGSSESLIEEFEKESIVLMIRRYVYDENIEYAKFMLSRRLYNGVTGKKNIESNIIVSYTNQNSRYNSLKENLKRTIMSVVGRFKIGSHKKTPHILVSDIEWNYAGNNNESQTSNPSNKGKEKPREELDNQLDIIEEKYAKMDTQPSKKRKRTSVSKPSTNDSSSTNFNDALLQIRDGDPAVQKNSEETVNSHDDDSD